ncbi:MAG TPA: ATP-binding cassette domain-containing protein [Candidatus Hydrogenedentes bacterium]|nr:MAG: putative ABC transporter ATP-binding protein [Candidatus Hydrogenedentes bacterium ADurb.Bin170]HNZ49506.1 ATP-binding cassette domain-containing protein [Candidatus Hydrogenedentota bacterium]HPX87574.1 ATP-binding cassette domain-containing protein [Candidatus Hydrogenedentota bacterium]HQB03529.1 ATP-binding cassette domain-containing protein [Candidatus Hydrogenedentota bacterium]
MSLLSIQNLSQSFDGKPILDGLTMDFWEGHIHAVVGPNGAGKSTLANTIMGLHGYTNYGGEIFFDGQSLRGVSVDARARMGITLAWQEPARFEGLSVLRFVGAGSKRKDPAHVKGLLEALGLEGERYLHRSVDRTLSGGERKRIELASILAMEPRLILMDEPDSGIDVAALDYIFTALSRLKNQGATVIMITHSRAVLEQADHAFLMCNGRLREKGEISKIGRYFIDRCIPCDHINEPDEEESIL